MNTLALLNEKLSNMNTQTIRQCQEEIASWKRVLGFLQAENNYLKIQLANQVNQDISHKFLNRAENLQNELIQKDELIALNKSALSDFDKYLNGYHENNDSNKNVIKRREKLRNQIEQLEQKFSRHRAEFNDHLSENF